MSEEELKLSIKQLNNKMDKTAGDIGEIKTALAVGKARMDRGDETRRDLVVVRTQLNAEIGHRIESDQEMRADMHRVETEVITEISAVKTEMAELKAHLGTVIKIVYGSVAFVLLTVGGAFLALVFGVGGAP